MIAEFDEKDDDGLTKVCEHGVEVYVPEGCEEVTPIVKVYNVANDGVDEALEADVKHTIQGDVTLLIDNYSSSMYDVTAVNSATVKVVE